MPTSSSPSSDRNHTVVPLPAPRVPVLELQGTLALDLQPRHDPPEVHPGAPAAVVPLGRAGDMRELESWAYRFGQAAVEIAGASRPASQLVRWTTEEVYADLIRRAQLVSRASHQHAGARRQPVRPKVVSVHASFVTDDIVEAALHVRYGERSRAVAARFEWSDERWLCTALDFA